MQSVAYGLPALPHRLTQEDKQTDTQTNCFMDSLIITTQVSFVDPFGGGGASSVVSEVSPPIQWSRDI